MDEWPSSFCSLQVAGAVEHRLTGRVPRHVHLAAAGDALGDDPGALQAAVPPLVQTVNAHRLVAVLGDELLPSLVPVGRRSRRQSR
jgi:hypothetical protein